MKSLSRFLAFTLFLSLCLPLLAGAPLALAGETVVYPGAGLATINGVATSLAPSGSSTGKSNVLSGNSVTVNSGPVGGNVYGAININTNETASNNTVFINGGVIQANTYGAYANVGLAASNTVTISGGQTNGDVYGGRSLVGVVTGNAVTVSNGQTNGDVYGGSSDSGEAAGNSVTINSGASALSDIIGGRSQNGAATNNTVTINSGGSVDQSVFGGNSISNAATGNKIIINGGSVVDSVFGGNANITGEASGNSILITNGGSVGQFVFGGRANSGVAANNTVTVSGGSIGGIVYGGNSSDGVATGNTVTLSGGTLGDKVYGGFSNTNAALGNTVTISGGTANQTVYGGYTLDGVATGNTVNLSGGAVGQNVYGGYSNNRSATGNMVTLYDTAMTATNNIFGGYSGAGQDAFSGNIFYVLKPQSGAVNSVQNFQFYRFVLPAGLASPMLTTTDLDLTDSFGGQAPLVDKIGIESEAPFPQVGDTYTLIAATNLIIQGAYAGNQVVGKKGLTLLYDMEAYIDGSGQNLMLKVLSAPVVNPESEALNEGHLAGLALVNQGSNLVTGAGLQSALAAAFQAGLARMATFIALDGGSSRYNTGSHVDIDSLSLMTGLSWQAPLDQNDLVMAIFFETGRGSYDSYNSFRQTPTVKANGDVNYYGGGLMARYGLTADSWAGLYGEASFHLGRTSTDFFSGDLVAPSGQQASYDSSANYYGAHAGLGYVLDLTEASRLDFSTKYLWARQGGDRVKVAGDTINFEAASSHRWRNGARYIYDLTTSAGAQWSPFVGAALDYEFDGEAKATAYGLSLPAPSLRGGTGVGELGVSFKPASNSALSLNLSVEGYTGKREGVSGNFLLKFEF